MMHKLLMALLASLVVPLWVLIIETGAILIGLRGENGSFSRALMGAALYDIYGSPVAFLLIMIFGIPIFGLLRRRGCLNVWSASVTGFCIGMVPMVPVAAAFSQRFGVMGLVFLGYGALMGISGAALFWRFGYRT